MHERRRERFIEGISERKKESFMFIFAGFFQLWLDRIKVLFIVCDFDVHAVVIVKSLIYLLTLSFPFLFSSPISLSPLTNLATFSITLKYRNWLFVPDSTTSLTYVTHSWQEKTRFDFFFVFLPFILSKISFSWLFISYSFFLFVCFFSFSFLLTFFSYLSLRSCLIFF